MCRRHGPFDAGFGLAVCTHHHVPKLVAVDAHPRNHAGKRGYLSGIRGCLEVLHVLQELRLTEQPSCNVCSAVCEDVDRLTELRKHSVPQVPDVVNHPRRGQDLVELGGRVCVRLDFVPVLQHILVIPNIIREAVRRA